MENIIEPNESFDFNQLTLAHPSGIQGGAYFTKIEYNQKPLYIQTTKSQTRQGFVKTGKKYYCDLMFDKNSETLLTWCENLEERCQNLLYSKRQDWFQNTLEKNDIESAFNSTIRIYKSGKYYLIRTNIKNTRNDEPAVKIYNESEVALDMSHITSETNIISILEIQGIKFTSRNFQIEIELKQIMVLNDEPIFNNCLIKTFKPKENTIVKHLDNTLVNSGLDNNALDTNTLVNNTLVNSRLDNNTLVNSGLDNNSLGEDLPLDNLDIDLDDEPQGQIEKMPPIDISVDTDINNTNISLDFEDLEEEDKLNELSEVNMDIHLDTLESIKLKKPNEVYFELYKEARNKAKLAKKNAIIAYLEAKNIKKTYMLEDMNDSDSEFDAEIDEASESELDGL